MPGLDVSDALLETEMQDIIVVERRADTITDKGRSNPVSQTFRQSAVVAPASPNDLERLPEQQHMRKTIVVITNFRLQGPSPGFQADVVNWKGDRFVVTLVDDFSAYGQGFINAICTSMDYVDQPPRINNAT